MIGILIVRHELILGFEGPFVNDFSLIAGRWWAEKRAYGIRSTKN